MKLQLALDTLTTEGCIALLDRVHSYVDIIEAGTPLIMREGLSAVTRLKERYPSHTVLADLKIMDAGAYEAEAAFRAGADVVTVLSVAHDSTVRGCVEAARACGGLVMSDMICCPDIPRRAVRLADMGVDLLCVHTAFDEQSGGVSPLGELEQLLTAVSPRHAAVAGGLKEATVPAAARLSPAVVVVGGGITGAEDPVSAARRLKELLV